MTGALILAGVPLDIALFLRPRLGAGPDRDDVPGAMSGADYLAVLLVVLAARAASSYGTEHWLTRCTVRIALAMLGFPAAFRRRRWVH